MQDEQSAVKKFLTGVENEQSNPFETEIKDPFATEETPVEEVVEEVKEEKPLPFHKDPKVLKFIEKEVGKRIGTREEAPRKEEQNDDEFKDVIDSFTAIIGNDTPEKVNALKALERSLKNVDQSAARKAEAKIEEIKNREAEADREAEEELSNALESIEESYDVDLTSPGSQKIRSEFISFVEKMAPKRNGVVVDYPDMNSAWETFSQMKKSSAQPNRAKELASRGLSRSSESIAAQPKRISWNDVDEMMDGLK